MELSAIQQALRDEGLDGWLFYDFRNRDAIAYRVLGLDFNKFTSRRWFYYIPASGEPQRLIHRVEPTKLDDLPGGKNFYLAWTELHAELARLLGPGPKKLAMQYSPLCDIPYISMADAGMVDLVRSFGHEICSSADLVQQFESVIDAEGYRSHLEAGERVQRVKDEAFAHIAATLRGGGQINEYEAQQFILRRFAEEGLTCTGEVPIVGVNDHPANPHFEPTPQNCRPIRPGDTLLIDLWAKLDRPRAIFYDITWCAFVGQTPPPRYVQIFETVRDARNTAVQFVRDRFAAGQPVSGCEVDDACRAVVVQRGFGPRFIHRTGHSIGEAVHGNGCNIDNLETRETRRLLPGSCFSIEPGIYLDGEMAVRSEINCFITLAGEVIVAGSQQEALVLLDV